MDPEVFGRHAQNPLPLAEIEVLLTHFCGHTLDVDLGMLIKESHFSQLNSDYLYYVSAEKPMFQNSMKVSI